MKLDGRLSYGYNEDGRCEVSWDVYPEANGGADKTLYELTKDIRSAITRDAEDLVRMAIRQHSRENKK